MLSVFVSLEDMDTDPEMSVGKVIKRGKEASSLSQNEHCLWSWNLVTLHQPLSLRVTELHWVDFPGVN